MSQKLEYVPPVVSKTVNKDSLTSFILTTDNSAKFDQKSQKRTFTNSVQVVDADQPWPPRWFQSSDVYNDEMLHADSLKGFFRFLLISDVRIIDGYFTYFRFNQKAPLNQGPWSKADLAGYMLLNKDMEAVDTVKSNVALSNLYFHDLDINAKGERLVSLRKDIYLDLRDYTENEKDKSVFCEIDIIQILDRNNKPVYSWNPLYHIDPSLFRYKETLADRTHRKDSAILWTRQNSAKFDYDGNVLYSLKNIGVGKFSREDGRIMWQINYNQMPIVTGKDTIEWYCQHDWNLLGQTDTTAIYSLYSDGEKYFDGDNRIPSKDKPACGVLFEQNKKNLSIKLLRYQHPRKRYASNGQGNFDYSLKNGNYVIGYGYLDEDNTAADFTDKFEYGRNDSTYGTYQLPLNIFCYKAHRLEGFPKPPRPVITIAGYQLQAQGVMQDWTWYRLSGNNNTIAEEVGKGKTFTGKVGGVYCVAGKYGVGYSVSKPVTLKKPTEGPYKNEPY